MFCSSHSFEATGESFQPLLQVETTSTSEKPLPAIEFSNALRIARLHLRTLAGVCTLWRVMKVAPSRWAIISAIL